MSADEILRVAILVLAIAIAWIAFRGRRRGSLVCGRCGYATVPGTPACPRCGRSLDMRVVDLGRLEAMRRRGEIDGEAYRDRKLSLIRGERPDDGDGDGGR